MSSRSCSGEIAGVTGKGRNPGAYSIDRLGRDVLELLDALRIERAHFLGLSLGGFVGQWLGIHTPERIDHLILSNTASYLGPPHQWDEIIASTLAAPDMTQIADMFLRNWFPAHMLQNRHEIVEAFRSMVLSTNRQGLAGAYAAIRDTDMRRTIALIPRPTLVIAGEHDSVTTVSHAKAIAETIPGARFRVMPTVHLPNVERPAEYMETILEFLESSLSDHANEI